MSNQYTKVTLFLEEDYSVDEKFFIENLSVAVVDSLKDILPKDIETLDSLISKIRLEL